ncbi:MAG: hypothetical protein ACTSRA_02180, partial [Promethearchaeota archaeon]
YFRPKLSYHLVKIAYCPILPMIPKWRCPTKMKNKVRIGNVIIHSMNPEIFEGFLKLAVMHEKNPEKQVPKEDKSVMTKKFKVKVSPGRPLRVCTLKLQHVPGTVVRLTLLDNHGKKICTNFSYPSMLTKRSLFTRLKDVIDVRFDGWWRKYMIKLMELARIREDWDEWKRKKEIISRDFLNNETRSLKEDIKKSKQ